MQINRTRMETKLTDETKAELLRYALVEFNGNAGLAIEKSVKELIKREKRKGGVLWNS